MAEKELGISCAGFVPELKECHLESRHLGLVMPDEVENLQEQVNLLAETLQKTLDFEKILAIAEGAEELSGKMPEVLRKVTESEAAANVLRSRFLPLQRMKHSVSFIGIIWSFSRHLEPKSNIFRRFPMRSRQRIQTDFCSAAATRSCTQKSFRKTRP